MKRQKAKQFSRSHSSAADQCLNAISLEYSYEDLRASTEDFNPATKLGQGAYGNVYRGVLRDGNEVAIKYLHTGHHDAGFEEEVKVLSKFRHQNLVILMGFSRYGTQRLLVYEFLAGGDVGSRLQKGPLLRWKQRLQIALDAACGLSHLHNQNPKVFHRDIKSANILLDRNGTAKWGDFGLACLSAKLSHKVHQTAGTVGYADPKYISTATVTEYTEVYSYGWVLIELLTAKPPAVQHHDGRISYLFSKLKDANTGTSSLRNLLALTDESAAFPELVRVQIAKLALRCINSKESVRPNFCSIVLELRKLLAECNNIQPYGTTFVASHFNRELSGNHLRLNNTLKSSSGNKCSHASHVAPSFQSSLARTLRVQSEFRHFPSPLADPTLLSPAQQLLYTPRRRRPSMEPSNVGPCIPKETPLNSPAANELSNVSSRPSDFIEPLTKSPSSAIYRSLSGGSQSKGSIVPSQSLDIHRLFHNRTMLRNMSTDSVGKAITCSSNKFEKEDQHRGSLMSPSLRRVDDSFVLKRRTEAARGVSKSSTVRSTSSSETSCYQQQGQQSDGPYGAFIKICPAVSRNAVFSMRTGDKDNQDNSQQLKVLDPILVEERSVGFVRKITNVSSTGRTSHCLDRTPKFPFLDTNFYLETEPQKNESILERPCKSAQDDQSTDISITHTSSPPEKNFVTGPTIELLSPEVQPCHSSASSAQQAVRHVEGRKALASSSTLAMISSVPLVCETINQSKEQVDSGRFNRNIDSPEQTDETTKEIRPMESLFCNRKTQKGRTPIYLPTNSVSKKHLMRSRVSGLPFMHNISNENVVVVQLSSKSPIQHTNKLEHKKKDTSSKKRITDLTKSAVVQEHKTNSEDQEKLIVHEPSLEHIRKPIKAEIALPLRHSIMQKPSDLLKPNSYQRLAVALATKTLIFPDEMFTETFPDLPKIRSQVAAKTTGICRIDVPEERSSTDSSKQSSCFTAPVFQSSSSSVTSPLGAPPMGNASVTTAVTMSSISQPRVVLGTSRSQSSNIVHKSSNSKNLVVSQNQRTSQPSLEPNQNKSVHNEDEESANGSVSRDTQLVSSTLPNPLGPANPLMMKSDSIPALITMSNPPNNSYVELPQLWKWKNSVTNRAVDTSYFSHGYPLTLCSTTSAISVMGGSTSLSSVSDPNSVESHTIPFTQNYGMLTDSTFSSAIDFSISQRADVMEHPIG